MTDTLTIYRVPLITAFTFNPNPVYGGFPTTGTVQLNGAVPIASTIYLAEASAFMSLPATSISLAVGANSGTFTLNTSAVTTDSQANVSAYVYPDTLARVNATAFVRTLPVLSAFTVNDNNVTGGTTVIGTLTLSRAAPPGGSRVTISDNSSSIGTPTVVTIPAGGTVATFPITTSQVFRSIVGTVFATYRGTTLNQKITITP